MLKTLDLTYFRRHESLHVDLTAGLNAVRGPNEAGKSTLLEAVLYALGGAKTLRDSLADTVTWGHKDRELKVQLVLEQSGHDHVFRRSKSGAECHYVDGEGKQQLITGQDEVTAKAAEILGCDLKMAANLMLSSQSGLRGAMEEGPTAVSNLMAKLADIEVIDRILKRADEALATGSAAPLQAKLESAQADLVAHQQEVLVDTTAELQAHIEQLRAEQAATQAQLDGPLGDAMQKAQDALANARNARALYLRNADGTMKAEAEVTRLAADLKGAQARAADRPSDDDIARAEAAAAAEKDHAAVLALHRRVTALRYPEAYWDEPVEKLHEAIEAADQKIRTMDADLTTRRGHVAQRDASIAAHEARLTTTLAGKITNGKCPTCGSQKESDQHVAEFNAIVEAKASDIREELGAMKRERSELHVAAQGVVTALREAHAEVNDLRKLLKDGKPFDDLAAAVEGNPLVEVDRSVYPPMCVWVGEMPAAVAGDAAAKALAALQARVRTATQAQGQVEVVERALAEAQQRLADWKQALVDTPDVNVGQFEVAQSEAWKAFTDASTKVSSCEQAVANVQRQIDAYTAAKSAHAQREAHLQSRIAEIQEELKTLAFNNAFIAKLRAMKPAVTDRLWNTVLAAASNFFSAMRGEASVISRTGGEFLINDKSFKSFSGSTLDVMALAIRVALTRTFLPHVPFISLDEPAHGCDDDRTGNLLGFLAGSGFKQVILASHDEMSEAVADNVIALGA